MMGTMPRPERRENARRRRARFGRIVDDALAELRTEIAAARGDGRMSDGLAKLFRDALDEVAVVVADEPDARQRREQDEAHDLLGLYEGVPRTEWAADHALVPPRITIFRRPIEDLSPSPAMQREEIRKTVKHEIAHHLGYSDDDLGRLGLGDAE